MSVLGYIGVIGFLIGVFCFWWFCVFCGVFWLLVWFGLVWFGWVWLGLVGVGVIGFLESSGGFSASLIFFWVDTS